MQLHQSYKTVLLAVFFVCGCKPCEENLISEELNRFFLNFQPGSYWIYQNEQNGSVDSVYVVKNSRRYEFDGSVGGLQKRCRYETAEVVYKGFSFTPDSVRLFISKQDSPTGIEVRIGNTPEQSKYILQLFENRCVKDTLFSVPGNLSNNAVKLGCKLNSGNPNLSFEITIFVENIGLSYWSVINHPKYRNASYRLLRFKIISI